MSQPGELSAADRTNLDRANRVALLHNIAIDHSTGAAGYGALFEREVVPAGIHFYGELSLQNYQAWQLGLLLYAFDQLDKGTARLGSSKGRGLGVVSAAPLSLIHEQRAGRERTPKAIGDLIDEGSRRSYGLFTEQPLPEITPTPRGLSYRFDVDVTQIDAWRLAGRRALFALDK